MNDGSRERGSGRATLSRGRLRGAALEMQIANCNTDFISRPVCGDRLRSPLSLGGGGAGLSMILQAVQGNVVPAHVGPVELHQARPLMLTVLIWPARPAKRANPLRPASTITYWSVYCCCSFSISC